MSTIPDTESYPKAKAAAIQALQIDETLAEAHTSLGYALKSGDWDWAGAEREFRRAIELNPGYATGRHWYSVFLNDMGRSDEAISEAGHALKLDPLAPVIVRNAGRVFFWAGRYEEAIEQYLKFLEVQEARSVRSGLGKIYEAQGRQEEAIAEYIKMEELEGTDAETIAAMKGAYDQSGLQGYWRERVRSLSGGAKEGVLLTRLADAYVRIGQKDDALDALEQAYRVHLWVLSRLKGNPDFAPLRSDPRFQDLLRRMNFPE